MWFSFNRWASELFFPLEVGSGGGGVEEVRNSILQKFSKTLSKNYLNS